MKRKLTALLLLIAAIGYTATTNCGFCVGIKPIAKPGCNYVCSCTSGSSLDCYWVQICGG